MSSFNDEILRIANEKGWQTIPLKYVFKRRKQFAQGTEELLSIYRDHGVVPKSSRTDNFNKPSDDLTKYQVVKPGDLVVNKMKAWQGSVAISEYGGIISPAYFIYEPVIDIYPRYVHYLLRSDFYTKYYLSISSGVRPNQWDLDPAMFGRILLLVPSKSEQITIANKLDNELAEIDGLIADQQRLNRLVKERYYSELEYELIGKATEFIELRRLNPICTSGTSVNGSPWPADKDQYGVLKTGVVTGGIFDSTQNKLVDEPDEIARLSTPVAAGTIIVNRANSPELVGSAAYIERDHPNLFLSDKLWQITFPNSNPKTLAMIFNTQYFKDQIRQRATGASNSMQNISYKDFTSIKVPKIIDGNKFKNIIPQSEIEAFANAAKALKERRVSATQEEIILK